jgi:hypothetical protein
MDCFDICRLRSLNGTQVIDLAGEVTLQPSRHGNKIHITAASIGVRRANSQYASRQWSADKLKAVWA